MANTSDELPKKDPLISALLKKIEFEKLSLEVQAKKRAVKMHTLLDYNGHLPAYVHITDGKTADNKGAYDVSLLKGSVIVSDRFYADFALLNVWNSNEVYFVVRHKDNIKFEKIKERELPENKDQHLLKDEIIKLTNGDF